jgi:hypothetical protein
MTYHYKSVVSVVLFCIHWFSHPVPVGSIETNWIRGDEVDHLLSNVWAKSSHFDIFMAGFFFIWLYPLQCDLPCTDIIVALQSLSWHTHGHLTYHLHKEVPLSCCLAKWPARQWDCQCSRKQNFFLGGLSSEQPLGSNLCALLFQSLLSSWQDVCTNAQGNKLQYIVWCAHYHFTHLEIVPMFWRKFKPYLSGWKPLGCLQTYLDWSFSPWPKTWLVKKEVMYLHLLCHSVH